MYKNQYNLGGKMERRYIAHINEELGTVQTVKEHSENVAILAREYAVEEFKEVAYITGLLHDCGKYQESFLKRISGSNIRVEHSTCGALAARDIYKLFIFVSCGCRFRRYSKFLQNRR